jgi:hypothetical protein
MSVQDIVYVNSYIPDEYLGNAILDVGNLEKSNI